MDVAEYRKKARREFTTKNGDTFTLRRVSAPRLIELFKQSNVPIGQDPDDLPPEKGIEIAVSLLPDVVDEVVAGDGDETHIGVNELAVADMIELFTEAMKMSGVSEEDVAKARAFRDTPPG